MAAAGLQSWFNNPNSYPDLLIRLCDGRELQLHRAIVCQNNEFFKTTYAGNGPHGTYESSDPVEDAEAYELILRNLYGFALPPYNSKSWLVWTFLIHRARTCQMLKLVDQAACNFTKVIFEQTDADVIIDILESPSLSKPATDKIRRKHCHILLVNERYRQMLENDRALMWFHLDHLINVSMGNATV